MNLRQAYKLWAFNPQNRELSIKYNEAVQKILMPKLSETELSDITENKVRDIFAHSDALPEDKTKAASMLVSVLTWGHDNKYNKSPKFDYTIASAEPKVDEKLLWQLDPNTFEVVNIYSGISDAQKRTHIGNITRAVNNRSLAGGYFWCFSGGREDVINSASKRKRPVKQASEKPHLRDISNDDLLDEIKRRGWKGTLEITIKVNL